MWCIIKKIIIVLSLCSILLCGCATKGNEQVVSNVSDHEQYVTIGRYYVDGSIVTYDGNVWGYQTEIISDEPSYNNEPVYVVFDDNGTETDIYDDVIIDLMLDVRTAIYDELEIELSKEFVLERENNNIKIIERK